MTVTGCFTSCVQVFCSKVGEADVRCLIELLYVG